MCTAVGAPQVLVVEDTTDDFHKIRETFRSVGIRNPVHWCGSGDVALEYLLQQAEPAPGHEARAPGLILLGLGLPGSTGKDALVAIRRHESLRRIPVIVLTSPGDAPDLHECHRLGIDGCLAKPLATPLAFAAFVAAMARLRGFWLDLAVGSETRWSASWNN